MRNLLFGLVVLGVLFAPAMAKAAAYSNLAELPEGLAKLDNFNAIGTVAAVTPEPLSSVLFLLGAGGMALARKKRLVRN